MSNCSSCARVITCPRPETRAVRLAFVEEESKVLAAFIAERISPEEAVPAQLYVEYVLFGEVSPYQVARRIYAAFFRTANDYYEFASFMDMLYAGLKSFPEQFLQLVEVSLSGAFQLFEWNFYSPHVARFGRLAKAASLDHPASGMAHADGLICARVPCSYMNLDVAVGALKQHPPKTLEEAKATVEAANAAAQERACKHMSHEDFMNATPVGGLN